VETQEDFKRETGRQFFPVLVKQVIFLDVGVIRNS